MELPTEFFEDDDYYTGPPAVADLVERAEAALGVRLPAAYKPRSTHRLGGQRVVTLEAV